MATDLAYDSFAKKCVLFVQALPFKTSSSSRCFQFLPKTTLTDPLSLRRWSSSNVLRSSSRHVPSLSSSTPRGFPLRFPNQQVSRTAEGIVSSPSPFPSPTSASSRYLQSLSAPRVAVSSETIEIGQFRLNLSPRFLLCLVPVLGASFVICAKLLYLLPCALPPPVFNSLRLIVASLVVYPIAAREIRTLQADRSYFWKLWPGIQLGLLVFVANLLQIIGLKYAPASRAAFINQLSTILVPLSAAALHIEPLTLRVAVGSFVALAGIGLLTAPSANAVSSAAMLNPSAGLAGDLLELASAGFTTAYVLRMGHFAQSLPTSRLPPMSAIKVVTQACMSLLWLAITSSLRTFVLFLSKSIVSTTATIATGAPNTITTGAMVKTASTAGVTSAVSATIGGWTPFAIFCNVLLILWAGGVSNTVSAWLQMKGQSRVSPSESAVLFAAQPLWTSVFAVVLLHESMPVIGIIGAVLIIIGAVLASTGKTKKQQ